MVSGFKTSPLDAAKIDSGDPSPIEILLNFNTELSCFLAIMVFYIIYYKNYSSNLISKPNPLSSCINTLNDSGNPGFGIESPLTIDS